MKLPINSCLFVALVLAVCVTNGRYLLIQTDGTSGGSPRMDASPWFRSGGEDNEDDVVVDIFRSSGNYTSIWNFFP